MPLNKRDHLLSELELACDMAKLEQRLGELGGELEWSCDTAKLDELLKEDKSVPFTPKAIPQQLTKELPSNLDELLQGGKNAAFTREADPQPLPSNLDELLEGGKNVRFARKPYPPPLNKKLPSTVALETTAKMASPTSRGLLAWFGARTF